MKKIFCLDFMKESLRGICSGEDLLYTIQSLCLSFYFRKILAEMTDQEVGVMMKVSRNWNTMLKQEANGLFAKMFCNS